MKTDTPVPIDPVTLSATAVISLINGLFGTDYPPDSTISYHWTEYIDKELRRILADTILTINGKYSYHIEAQMERDDDIVFLVFDYGYGHAQTTFHDYIYTLKFPEPKILYLFTSSEVPDQYTLHLDFGTQGSFDYTVHTFQYLKHDPRYLTDQKMIILIPFELLKLREAMKLERSEENKAKLQSLIQNDIIGSINQNLELGNITRDDARKLKRLTHQLYHHIYAHYEELEEVTELTDESLILDIDIIEKEHEAELARKEQVIAIKEQTINEQEQTIDRQNQTINSQNQTIASKDAEIAKLKAQLAKYSSMDPN